MESSLKHSINAYKRLFIDNNEYIWKSEHSKDFLKFQVIELDDFTGKIRVSVKILDYRKDGISKKLLDRTGLMLFDRIMRKPLNFDLSICSIKDFLIYIINESKFSLPEKQKLKPTFTIYTGRGGFDTLRESSYLFNDDRDDLMMSYEMGLRVNRNR
jgi:hypothetical protein